MKKIILFLMPMFIAIAIIFYINNRDFDFVVFLNYIGDLRFSNTIDHLSSINDIWSQVQNSFGSISEPKGASTLFDIIDNLKNIGNGIFHIFRILWALATTCFYAIGDLFRNVFSIAEYLFFIN